MFFLEQSTPSLQQHRLLVCKGVQYPGAGMGCVPRSPPSLPPPPPVISGDGSAWAFKRQVYKKPTQQVQAVEGQALPTSSRVSEPSLHQHSSVPYQQWAAGSAAGASTAQSHAGAYPAMAVNTLQEWCSQDHVSLPTDALNVSDGSTHIKRKRSSGNTSTLAMLRKQSL